MNKLYLIALFIFTFKLISNIWYYFSIKKLAKIYYDFLSNHNNMEIFKKTSEVIYLLKKAKIKDIYILTTTNRGILSLSFFNSFPSYFKEQASAAQKYFYIAEGTFYKNIKDCFNPIYWIDLIVFAPKHIFMYVGLDTNKVFIKILILFFNFIFWFISVLIIPVFQDEIKLMIINLLKIFR